MVTGGRPVGVTLVSEFAMYDIKKKKKKPMANRHSRRVMIAIVPRLWHYPSIMMIAHPLQTFCIFICHVPHFRFVFSTKTKLA